MSVLDRDELSASPLADLHAIANDLGVDGYRRLRKAELIDVILNTTGGASTEPAAASRSRARSTAAGESGRTATHDEGEETPRRRTRGRAAADDDGEETGGDAAAEDRIQSDGEDGAEEPRRRERSTRRSRGGRGRGRSVRDRDEREDAADDGDLAATPGRGDQVAEGVVELLDNGSAFLRVDPPDPSDEDVYVSAAQVRRCDLVSGDRVTGPVRAPRRSERYPSLIRVDTINGTPASTAGEGTRFDDLPAQFPFERFVYGSEDPTLRAIEWLTPLGRGSRAVIAGPPRSGKTEALRRLAAGLAAQDGIEVTVVLVGARPEEVAEWEAAGVAAASAHGLAASSEAQGNAVERAIEEGRRIAARGGNAAILIDSLDGVPPHVVRRALGSARRIVDGGSLTVIATAAKPVGGETTVIALDLSLTSTGRLPALDLANSGTIRAELLVGDAGAEAIAQARANALGI